MKRVTDKQKRAMMRKAKQLAAADMARRAGKDPVTREVHIKAIRGKDAILFQTRTGYFSPRTGPMYTLSDLDIAEALDKPGHMAAACAKLGFVMLCQVLRYKQPAQGIQAMTDIADAAAKWLGLDVEALRAELAAERAAEEANGQATDATVAGGGDGVLDVSGSPDEERVRTDSTPGQGMDGAPVRVHDAGEAGSV